MTNLISDMKSHTMINILSCYWDFHKKGEVSMAEKRKDKKDRVLYSDKEEGASIGELLSLQGLNIDVE